MSTWAEKEIFNIDLKPYVNIAILPSLFFGRYSRDRGHANLQHLLELLISAANIHDINQVPQLSRTGNLSRGHVPIKIRKMGLHHIAGGSKELTLAFNVVYFALIVGSEPSGIGKRWTNKNVGAHQQAMHRSE